PDGSLRNLRVRIARTSMMCLHDAHALCDGLPDLSQQAAAPQFLARPGTWVALNRRFAPPLTDSKIDGFPPGYAGVGWWAKRTKRATHASRVPESGWPLVCGFVERIREFLLLPAPS